MASPSQVDSETLLHKSRMHRWQVPTNVKSPKSRDGRQLLVQRLRHTTRNVAVDVESFGGVLPRFCF